MLRVVYVGMDVDKEKIVSLLRCGLFCQDGE